MLLYDWPARADQQKGFVEDFSYTVYSSDHEYADRIRRPPQRTGIEYDAE